MRSPCGIPSHDTFGRVFSRLDPKQFHQYFLSWTQSVSELTQGTIVSLDGKTIRASFDRATELSPVHLVSAWCSQNGGLVMGQLKTESKSNETLKRNHKKTYHAVATHFHDHIEPNLSWRDDQNFFDAFDDSHGRTVRRRVWSLSDLSPISDLDKWEGLNSIVAVETIRKAHSQAEITSDYRFYLSSLIRSAKTLPR